MAKNANKKSATMTEVKALDPNLVVTVKDLVNETGLDGKRIRGIIRSLGFRAPATGAEGMAPRFKYEWAADSKKLAKIREALQAYVDSLEEVDEAELA